MALPSQASPHVRSRAHMYRRKRGKRHPFLAAFFVISILALLIWYLLPERGSAQQPEPAQSIGMLPAQESENDSETPDESISAILDPTLNDDSNSDSVQALNPSTESDEPPAIVMGSGQTDDQAAAPTTARPEPPVTEQPQRPKPEVLANITPKPAASDVTPAPRGSSTSSLRLQQLVRNGMEQLATNKLVEARRSLSLALASDQLIEQDAEKIRQALKAANDQLVFSPLVMDGDQFSLNYTIMGGDLLTSIVKRFALQVDWRFIQRINNISSPSRIRAGQRIKLVTGPFHAVVHKNSYRMDLFLGDEEDRVYVRSYPVGLGTSNSTPVGMFRIRPDSKLINPQWPDPNTGRIFKADDPMNPIGERWLGLEGLDDRTRSLSGYGIHGTIDPESIGTQASMGCVRMNARDVEIIYEVLIESMSTVEIRDD